MYERKVDFITKQNDFHLEPFYVARANSAKFGNLVNSMHRVKKEKVYVQLYKCT